MTRLYWIDTGWGCGGIIVAPNNIIIPGGAPIFKKFIGQSIEKLKRSYKIQEIKL